MTTMEPISILFFHSILSLSSSFLIEWLLKSKKLFSERCLQRLITLGWTHLPFWSPKVAISDFEGGVELHAILRFSEYPSTNRLVSSNISLESWRDLICYIPMLCKNFGKYSRDTRKVRIISMRSYLL